MAFRPVAEYFENEQKMRHKACRWKGGQMRRPPPSLRVNASAILEVRRAMRLRCRIPLSAAFGLIAGGFVRAGESRKSGPRRARVPPDDRKTLLEPADAC